MSDSPSSKLEECGKTVSWWEGDYEGECELPKGHLEPFHYDGVSYYDSDGENRDIEQADLNVFISQERTAAQIEVLETFLHGGTVSQYAIKKRLAELKGESQ